MKTLNAFEVSNVSGGNDVLPLLVGTLATGLVFSAFLTALEMEVGGPRYTYDYYGSPYSYGSYCYPTWYGTYCEPAYTAPFSTTSVYYY